MPAIPYSTKIHNSYNKNLFVHHIIPELVHHNAIHTVHRPIQTIKPYVELCTTSNPGHHHHLTKLALCLTSYDAASPAQRSVSKSTLCRPVVRYHLFVILHRLSNSFCDNGNKRFFWDLPIDCNVLSPACEQKRAAKLEIALDSHLPCHP